MLTSTMTLTVIGCAHYNMDSGPLSQVFAMVNDPANKSVKGFALAKITATEEVIKNLPQDATAYPLTADFEVTNKVSGGKLTQCLQRYIPVPAKQSAPKAN